MDQEESDTQAYLEVTLPDFGMPVLYEEQLFLGLRKKYHYPPYLVEGYQNYAEKIGHYGIDDPKGAALANCDDFAQSKQTAQDLGE